MRWAPSLFRSQLGRSATKLASNRIRPGRTQAMQMLGFKDGQRLSSLEDAIADSCLRRKK